MNNNGIFGLSLKRPSAIYFIFTISGASALIYQVIWARWLGLVFGNTTLSVSIVLGSFMMGLAAGSWLVGRFLGRIENPMLFYVFMEIGIGIFALCFPLVTGGIDLFFTAVVSSGDLTASSVLIRAVFSVMALLIPTTLMGTTLPLLTDFFHRSPSHSRNWKAGLLYATNTLGAALGIIAASFILIELVGVRSTTFVAAGLNFIAAIIGYAYSRSSVLVRGDSISDYGGRLDGAGRFAIAAITASGFLALASEVLWTRTLETIIGNSTYAFATIVSLYLLGIAAGSWMMSLLVTRIKGLSVWFASMLLGMGVWMVVSIELFEHNGGSMAGFSQTSVPLSTVLGHYLEAVAILVPLAILSGACFPLATRMIDRESEDAKGVHVARVYAWNTVGALLGSFVTGFIIAPFSDFISSLYVLTALYCLTALLLYVGVGFMRQRVPYGMRFAAVLGAVAVGFVVFSLIRVAGKDYIVRQFNERHTNYRLVYHRPGLQGVTSVIKHKTDFRKSRLLVNGIGMTAMLTETKLMAHLPMLLHPDPEDALVICFGMGTTYRSAVSHGKNVTVVELDKEVAEAFEYFHEDAAAVRAYPRGKIVINDGRNFLKATRQKFDVITIDPPPPINAAGVNNLHSREFMELAREHLKKGGIMAHWMPYPGQAGVDSQETHEMLIRTFAQVFPYVYAHRSINNVGLHMIGSMEPIDMSVSYVQGKLSNAAAVKDINEWEKVPANFFESGWMTLPPEYYTKSVITDNEPYLEFYLLRTLGRGDKKAQPGKII